MSSIEKNIIINNNNIIRIMRVKKEKKTLRNVHITYLTLFSVLL